MDLLSQPQPVGRGSVLQLYVRLHRGTQPIPLSQVFSKEFSHAPVTGMWEPDQMRTEKPSIR